MTNRLASEASPYLRQHAENPVDWYPWGEEALAKARTEDKPILLSIGYSACHWCHVMERESFSDPAIAGRMNELFVNVKVDREERPDLDQVYQLVVQLLGRSGGWPLTVFLTPDQKPFFGGTYFPPVDRHGLPAFPKILAAVADAYRGKRDDVALQAAELTQAIAQAAGADPTRTRGEVPADLLRRVVPTLERRFDDENGGFGARPKFPNTMALDLLLLHGVRNDDARARARVARALDAMRDGGIHDQLGGGFHRYSTDAAWRVPHFEKMLYDNALLLRLYADGYRAFGDASYADVARGIVGWLEREMRGPGGAFHASQDADSEGEEGKFFVFRPSDVRAALGDDALAIDAALRRFGIDDEGNFEETGATVLRRAAPIEAIAIALGRSPSDVEAALGRATGALLAYRARRARPFQDEKILTSWNALVIQALASAASALDDAHVLELAQGAYRFVREKLVVRDGSALRANRLEKDGVVKGPGFLDDQAYLLVAARELHEATGEPTYLDDAVALGEGLLRWFVDPDGDFTLVGRGGEELIAAPRDAWDASVPSGAAIAMRGLLYLGSVVDPRFLAPATTAIERAVGSALENPFGYGATLRAADELTNGVEVFVAGTAAESQALASVARRGFHPQLRLVRWPPDREPAPALAEGRRERAGQAFVCVRSTCSLPVSTGPELLTTLQAALKSLK
jgi:uncharacterized protein YyaL (SSP411 family)